MSLNIVHLVGRAGRDPEHKLFEDTGNVLCTLTLAVRRPTSKNDEPDWFNLEFWGKTAETAINYVRKGSLIGIQGSLKMKTWTDRDTGVERSTPTIKVDKLDLLGSKRDNEASSGGGYYGEM
jgi:single-strand DNA-binding protein